MNSPMIAVFKKGKVELLTPLSLPEGIRLLVTPIRSDSELENLQMIDDWSNLSLQGLNLAYDDNEPEYTLEQIKEFNPDYEGS
jgi:hypothetical protein